MRISAETTVSAAKLWMQGYTRPEIMYRLKLTSHQYNEMAGQNRELFPSHGRLAPHLRELDDELKAKIIKLYTEKGKSIYVISQHLKMREGTVRSVIYREVEPRPKPVDERKRWGKNTDNLTAFLAGDPERGRSALCKRQSAT